MQLDVRRRPGVPRVLFWIVFLLASMWAATALIVDFRVTVLQAPLAALYACLAIVALLRPKTLLLSLVSFALVAGWWLTLQPSNDRPWQLDVDRLPATEIRGNEVKLTNVRNFEYRTEADYTPHWETRTVDLSRIRGVDLFVTHWGSPYIAHAIVSFRFGAATDSSEDTFLAMSIEARKIKGQEYSAFLGFFRQFELIHLVADEHDVIRLRTNYRTGEVVRLYRTLMNPHDSRAFFLQFLQWLERQRAQPEWYNALTDNCSSSLTSYLTTQHIGGVSKWDPRQVANGLAEEMLFQHGDLETAGLSFEEFSQKAIINDSARQLDPKARFSQEIRRGRPGF